MGTGQLRGHVNISVKGLPASPGSFTSVYESYSRETEIFICVLATQVFVSFQLNSSVQIKELGYLPKSPVNNHLDTQPLATVFTVTVVTLPVFGFNLHITFKDRN